MKKTVEVLPLLVWGNHQLGRTDEWASKEFKAGICTMVEQALHLSGTYKGFGFINNEDSECGTLGYYSRFYYTHYKLLK